MDYTQKEEEYNFLSDIIYLLGKARPPLNEDDMTLFQYKMHKVLDVIFHRRDQLDA